MKNLLIIFLVICCPFFVNGQDLEVAGKAKIETMDSDNTANNVVVRLADGTLAIRDASTIPNVLITVYDTIYQVLSISNDTIYLSYGGFVKLPADADTQLSESEVEGFIEGDETSFTSWDKDASDDLQIGTTSTTALAGNTTIPSNNNELANGSAYITTSALTPYQEISGTSTWDKDASDDLQIGTTATTALAGNTTIPSNNNELANGSNYITSSSLTPYQDTSGTTSWDKDASDDLQLGTTATTALAGDFTEVDGSTTNEIQMLTVSNDSIYISGGNGIKLRAHYVGELMGVGGIDGVVFYVDHTGQHGLICSSHDIAETAGDSTMRWDNGTTQILTNATSHWDGETNTTTILSVESESIAASKCYAYSTTGTSAGDWYLPAIGELSKMWHAAYEISKALDVDNAFEPNGYWSSSEFGSSYAWYFLFTFGHQYYNDKTSSRRVRAVRAF